jgi:carbon storage regulator
MENPESRDVGDKSIAPPSIFTESAIAMLVLARKVGEKILIGENISITVVRVAQGIVRIGIEAPNEMPIVREEIKEQMLEQALPKESTNS